MCTSVAIGFYIKNEEDFLNFKEKIQQLSRTENSIFSVYEKKPMPIDMDLECIDQKMIIESDM